MALIEEFRIRIPSDTAAGHSVQERIVSRLEELQYSSRDVFGVRLALEEALVNAIKHGNRMDRNKHVDVFCQIHDGLVHIEIEDQGPGFKPADIPDPTSDENLERPGGRGILLMRSFMSLVEYNDRGNKIVLEKEKETETAAD
ncbi:MAG: ATP-binding protein [Planctomycetales bacterium]